MCAFRCIEHDVVRTLIMVCSSWLGNVHDGWFHNGGDEPRHPAFNLLATV